MKKFIKGLFALTLIFSATGGSALTQAELQSHMVNDLDLIKAVMKTSYAPKEWKYTYDGWNLEEKIDEAKIKVNEQPDTLKDYQYIINQFFKSTKDYHVSTQFFSTEYAIIPLHIQSAGGKYFVRWACPELFELWNIDIKQGDELIAFDGRPVDQVVQELKQNYFSDPQSLTDQALAELSLTWRFGSSGDPCPEGMVSITIRHQGTKKLSHYQLPWIHEPEEIHSPLTALMKSAQKSVIERSILKRNQKLAEHPFFKKDMSTPLYEQQMAARKKVVQKLRSLKVDDDDDFDDIPNVIGARKSPLPHLGQVIWETAEDDLFHAYIFKQRNGKKIGYIRIPEYAPSNDCTEHAYRFAEIMNDFNKRTDALVVDQLNNPGGSVPYVYSIASMLTDREMIVPKHRVTITPEDLQFIINQRESLEAVENDEDAISAMGAESLDGYPVSHELVKNILSYGDTLFNEWNSGRTQSDLVYLWEISTLQPHSKGHYKKPVLLLINELDFSGGDFLPAILQDNKRVTIMGTRTAGAGGYVLTHTYPNLFGVVGFRYTGSIAERLNGKPIENLGVTPDIEASLTPRDLEFNYEDYSAKVLKAVNELL